MLLNISEAAKAAWRRGVVVLSSVCHAPDSQNSKGGRESAAAAATSMSSL